MRGQTDRSGLIGFTDSPPIKQIQLRGMLSIAGCVDGYVDMPKTQKLIAQFI